MSGYERGIAAERELLMKEFAHKYQTASFDVSSADHHEVSTNDYMFDHRDRYHHTNDDLDLYHVNNMANPIEADGGVSLISQDGMLTSGQSGDTVHDNRKATKESLVEIETSLESPHPHKMPITHYEPISHE